MVGLAFVEVSFWRATVRVAMRCRARNYRCHRDSLVGRLLAPAPHPLEPGDHESRCVCPAESLPPGALDWVIDFLQGGRHTEHGQRPDLRVNAVRSLVFGRFTIAFTVDRPKPPYATVRAAGCSGQHRHKEQSQDPRQVPKPRLPTPRSHQDRPRTGGQPDSQPHTSVPSLRLSRSLPPFQLAAGARASKPTVRVVESLHVRVGARRSRTVGPAEEHLLTRTPRSVRLSGKVPSRRRSQDHVMPSPPR